jgi:hypothetical protein
MKTAKINKFTVQKVYRHKIKRDQIPRSIRTHNESLNYVLKNMKLFHESTGINKGYYYSNKQYPLRTKIEGFPCTPHLLFYKGKGRTRSIAFKCAVRQCRVED